MTFSLLWPPLSAWEEEEDAGMFQADVRYLGLTVSGDECVPVQRLPIAILLHKSSHLAMKTTSGEPQHESALDA